MICWISLGGKEIMASRSPNPTPEESDSEVNAELIKLLALEPYERIPYVERIRIKYPRWLHIYNQIAECHERQSYASEPPCMLLVGPTGVGKTMLINTYAEMYPITLTKNGTHVPILRGSIPSSATISTLLTELLTGLGDLRADRGTIGGKTFRLRNLIRDCGVELFILDEVQHFFDQDSQRILLNVSNWLKTLIKDTKVACVLVGLEGQAEQVVDANPQLARLFGDPYILSPFRWNIENPQTIVEFRTFLYKYETLLPLRDRQESKLSSNSRAMRIYAASNGLMARIMRLLRQATIIALKNNTEYLTDTFLAEAYDKYLAPNRQNMPNPFVGDIPTLELVVPPLTLSGLPASNNRSKQRKTRKKTTRDIVKK